MPKSVDTRIETPNLGKQIKNASFSPTYKDLFHVFYFIFVKNIRLNKFLITIKLFFRPYKKTNIFWSTKLLCT
jgi:hypothetical protein